MTRRAPNPPTISVRYNFVRDDGKWKIDDISGASDGEAWSIRGMLTDSSRIGVRRKLARRYGAAPIYPLKWSPGCILAFTDVNV